MTGRIKKRKAQDIPLGKFKKHTMSPIWTGNIKGTSGVLASSCRLWNSGKGLSCSGEEELGGLFNPLLLIYLEGLYPVFQPHQAGKQSVSCQVWDL